MKRPKSNFYLFLSTQTDGIFSTFDAYRRHLQSQNRQKQHSFRFFFLYQRFFTIETLSGMQYIKQIKYNHKIIFSLFNVSDSQRMLEMEWIFKCNKQNKQKNFIVIFRCLVSKFKYSHMFILYSNETTK